jgi:SAM-dependent methyltransferase
MTAAQDLVVPERFNRNSWTVTSLMPPEESGQWLLARLQSLLGLADLASTKMLDFGCGVRFTQAILNRKLPIAQYAGVDCFPEMIEFLRESVSDPRFSFEFLPAHHPLYCPAGSPLTPSMRLSLPLHHFDLACMFSVITHQHPGDSRAIFSILRRHVRPDGHLFFTCFLDPAIDSFEDRSPEGNGGRCFYSAPCLEQLLGESGWAVVGRFAAEAPLIGDSFLCRPVREG